MTGDLIYVYLSGSHKTLPKSEVLAIAEAEEVFTRVVLDLDQVLVLYSSEELARLLKLRSAFSRKIGKVLWVGHSERLATGVREAAEILKRLDKKSLRLEYRCVRGLSDCPSYKSVLEVLASRGIKLEKDSEDLVDIIVSQGIVVIGLREYEVKTKEFFDRWAHRRPAYLPGALNPDISRIFVNLSRASLKRESVYYDPFCGVGSFLIEACFIGLKYIGSDIDEKCVAGAFKNLRSYGCEPSVFLADACHMPVDRVDAIGTDMPYGRQTKPHGADIAGLVKCFLENAESVLTKGSFVVFSQSVELEDYVYEAVRKLNFELVEVHRNWVHGSLTRNIYVLRKV